MRTTVPDRLVVARVPDHSEMTVYRIVRSDHRDDPVLLNSLRSNYELSGEPRKVERAWTAIHMGISTYSVEESARQTAQTFPKLGDYIAQISLRPGRGINWASTGHPLHLTVWADPVKLLDAVVDIQPV